MGPLAAIVLALAATHVQVADGSVHQCYVCEPRGGDPTSSLATTFKDQQPILNCEDFKRDDPRFIKNCPPNSKGCLVQTVLAGHHMTRTCAEIPIKDCPVANGVQYCYCNTPLCNHHPDNPPPDDEPEEDSVEGSATGDDHHNHHHKTATGTVPTRPATTTFEPHVSAAGRTLAPVFLVAAPLFVLLGRLRTD